MRKKLAKAVKIANDIATISIIQKTVIKMIFPILLLIELFESLIPAIVSITIHMYIKIEALVKNVAGKFKKPVIKGVMHKKPIKNRIQKPIKRSFLVVTFFTKRATVVPPIIADIIATILNKITKATITNTIITGRTNIK